MSLIEFRSWYTLFRTCLRFTRNEMIISCLCIEIMMHIFLDMKHKYQNIQVFVSFICIRFYIEVATKAITVTGNYVLTCNLQERRKKNPTVYSFCRYFGQQSKQEKARGNPACLPKMSSCQIESSFRGEKKPTSTPFLWAISPFSRRLFASVTRF